MYQYYDIKKTIRKFWKEGVSVSIIGAISVWTATQAQAKGIDLDPEWFVTGTTAIGSAVVRAISNWWKNKD